MRAKCEDMYFYAFLTENTQKIAFLSELHPNSPIKANVTINKNI